MGEGGIFELEGFGKIGDEELVFRVFSIFLGKSDERSGGVDAGVGC